MLSECLYFQNKIEKCSSPTGDGNFETFIFYILHIVIEKCSSPTGDGNTVLVTIGFLAIIEKCSSPTGDGNEITRESREFDKVELRNAVPRQGTETIFPSFKN